MIRRTQQQIFTHQTYPSLTHTIPSKRYWYVVLGCFCWSWLYDSKWSDCGSKMVVKVIHLLLGKFDHLASSRKPLLKQSPSFWGPARPPRDKDNITPEAIGWVDPMSIHVGFIGWVLYVALVYALQSRCFVFDPWNCMAPRYKGIVIVSSSTQRAWYRWHAIGNEKGNYFESFKCSWQRTGEKHRNPDPSEQSKCQTQEPQDSIDLATVWDFFSSRKRIAHITSGCLDVFWSLRRTSSRPSLDGTRPSFF